MKLSEFYYDLPKELIAQEPMKERDMSRLMVLDRETRDISEKVFKDIEEYIFEGDCLVLNNTRVMPVRLLGKRKTGANVEIFLLNPGAERMKALIRPSKRIKEKETIRIKGGIEAVVLGAADVGRFVEFHVSMDEVLRHGHMPLPPYIAREDNSRDREDYQTVYACNPGATASPTAGLHFTRDLIGKLRNKGVSVVYVTLHTSYGTFAPVKEDNIEDHVMHREYYEMSQDAADKINDVKEKGGRIFAVGTTSIRVLETASEEKGRVEASKGETDLFVYPGYDFKMVDAIITNFHLPESTLLMLVSAFSGKSYMLEGYRRAIDLKFRFFSYGDAMLIL
ncbi:MAG: tRNA preQ1(34) S-adenosylmethionine ribosyltransferase-isomerase QueA [Candidatus Omnitrophica bacterium]|nr:tRNA preQ1(34) S-adenosylmethionine ribosyltransferase-isomerase QueA [Candidatus Omnitrophota bacterium]